LHFATGAGVDEPPWMMAGITAKTGAAKHHQAQVAGTRTGTASAMAGCTGTSGGWTATGWSTGAVATASV
jgi:hypothetical protein